MIKQCCQKWEKRRHILHIPEGGGRKVAQNRNGDDRGEDEKVAPELRA